MLKVSEMYRPAILLFEMKLCVCVCQSRCECRYEWMKECIKECVKECVKECEYVCMKVSSVSMNVCTCIYQGSLECMNVYRDGHCYQTLCLLRVSGDMYNSITASDCHI